MTVGGKGCRTSRLFRLFLPLPPQIKINMRKVKKTSDIKIRIRLDEGNVPERITWSASDGPQAGNTQEAKAMLLALFDRENKETFKIDLWTKEMQVMEMDRFFFQTLRALADTYYKATQNAKLASDMQKFVHYFGEQTEIISKQ